MESGRYVEIPLRSPADGYIRFYTHDAPESEDTVDIEVFTNLDEVFITVDKKDLKEVLEYVLE